MKAFRQPFATGLEHGTYTNINHGWDRQTHHGIYLTLVIQGTLLALPVV